MKGKKARNNTRVKRRKLCTPNPQLTSTKEGTHFQQEIFQEEEVKNSLIPRSTCEEGWLRLVLESFVNEIPELLCMYV